MGHQFITKISLIVISIKNYFLGKERHGATKELMILVEFWQNMDLSLMGTVLDMIHSDTVIETRGNLTCMLFKQAIKLLVILVVIISSKIPLVIQLDIMLIIIHSISSYLYSLFW